VESASWILVASSLILFILNQFVIGASSQKMLDDDAQAEQRLCSSRWLQDKQAVVTVGVTISESVSNDEESNSINSEEICILPVKPRFTDYYCVATICKTEEQDLQNEPETSNVPID